MKLWTFYIKTDELNKHGVYEKKYALKAFTNNKEYALMFAELRDIKKFIVRKHKVTKEEYIEFVNEHQGKKLDLYNVKVRKSGKHTINNTIDIDMLLTYDEHMYIEEPPFILEDSSFWDGVPFPYIFRNKYFNALNAMQYVPYLKIMKDIFNLPHAYTKFLDEDDDDYTVPEFILDPVSLLLDISEDNF